MYKISYTFTGLALVAIECQRITITTTQEVLNYA